MAATKQSLFIKKKEEEKIYKPVSVNARKISGKDFLKEGSKKKKSRKKRNNSRNIFFINITFQFFFLFFYTRLSKIKYNAFATQFVFLSRK